MRKVLASEFVSLDGVAESPDRWQLPYFSDEMGEAVGSAMGASDAMLLGRVTYQEFESYFPGVSSEDQAFADYMNDTPKFVVSTTLEKAEWNNSTLIKDNIAEEIMRLKQQPGKDIGISGSIALVQSLLRENLLDELRLMIHSVVVGNGKCLLENVGDQKALESSIRRRSIPVSFISPTSRRTTEAIREPEHLTLAFPFALIHSLRVQQAQN